MNEPTRLQLTSEWMRREQERATIDRVTDLLCPPEPPLDAASYAMRYAFAPAIKRPNDFGVIAINSIA